MRGFVVPLKLRSRSQPSPELYSLDFALLYALGRPLDAHECPLSYDGRDVNMNEVLRGSIVDYLAQSRDVLERAKSDRQFIEVIEKSVECIFEALANGRKVLLAGNGGSAADAQHIAGEFLSRLYYDRAPVPAIALTTDSSVMTAIGNDYGYEHLFERQVLGLGQSGDIFIAISTSGRSPNILCAADAARKKGLIVIGFTGGSGSELKARCDLALLAPSDSTPLIQQVHITAGHIICGLVEERLFPRVNASRDSAIVNQ